MTMNRKEDVMMNQQPHILTAEESAFAAEHHHLIYTYLANRHLPAEEFYDVVVFGYLNGVRKHFRREDLQDYAFTTLAWRAMDACFANYVRTKQRPSRKATVISLQAHAGSRYRLEEIIAGEGDTAEEAIQALVLEDALSSFERGERELIRLLYEGYPQREIRRTLGITAEELDRSLIRLQEKTREIPALQAA